MVSIVTKFHSRKENWYKNTKAVFVKFVITQLRCIKRVITGVINQVYLAPWRILPIILVLILLLYGGMIKDLCFPFHSVIITDLNIKTGTSKICDNQLVINR